MEINQESPFYFTMPLRFVFIARLFHFQGEPTPVILRVIGSISLPIGAQRLTIPYFYGIVLLISDL
jgi:hypothetical protein